MTQAEVMAILGPPAKVYGSYAWHYKRPMRFGYVQVYFDGQGRFTDYNYEEF